MLEYEGFNNIIVRIKNKIHIKYDVSVVTFNNDKNITDQDILDMFISEKCTIDNNSFISSKDLLEEFNDYTNAKTSQQSLKQQLANKGILQIRKNINNSKKRGYPMCIRYNDDHTTESYDFQQLL